MSVERIRPSGNPGSAHACPATILNGIVFVSGQTGNGPIETAALDGLNQLKSILEAAGSSLNKIAKCNVYLADMDDFDAMNKVYVKYFDGNAPARTCVSPARLPHGASFEIECIAAARAP